MALILMMDLNRPVTRSRTQARKRSWCKGCCREGLVITHKHRDATQASTCCTESKSRKREIPCSSIRMEALEAAITKKLTPEDSGIDMPPPSKRTKKNMKRCEFDGTLPELPEEIWIKIFRMVVHNYGQYPFMFRAPRVCKRWYQICQRPALWRYVNLAYVGILWIPLTDASLSWLSKHRLGETRCLNLSGWHCLTADGIEYMARYCPYLTSINLSFCSHLHEKSIFHLTKYCKDLSCINLSNTNADMVCLSPIKHLVQETGTKLMSLNLSGNAVRGFNTVMKEICVTCPNLEKLDVSRCRLDFLVIEVERWQSCLPRLKVLSFGYSLFTVIDVDDEPETPGVGFPCLEELSLAVSCVEGLKSPLPINDDILRRFLIKRDRLRVLDIQGSRYVSAQLLLDLDFPSIEELQLGINSGDAHQGLPRLMEKYGCQLKEVSLGWTKYPVTVLTTAVQTLVRAPNSSLHHLDIAGTLIEPDLVRDIHRFRPEITRLDLKNCRNLPKKWQRLFNTPSRMKDFHRLIDEHYKENKPESQEAMEEAEAEQGKQRKQSLSKTEVVETGEKKKEGNSGKRLVSKLKRIERKRKKQEELKSVSGMLQVGKSRKCDKQGREPGPSKQVRIKKKQRRVAALTAGKRGKQRTVPAQAGKRAKQKMGASAASGDVSRPQGGVCAGGESQQM